MDLLTISFYSDLALGQRALMLYPYRRIVVVFKIKTLIIFIDYFKQSIQMSGSIFAAWAFNKRVVNETKRLIKELHCNLKNDNVELKTCLKSKSMDEIFDAEKIIVCFKCKQTF